MLLAEGFIRKFAQRMGRVVDPLSAEMILTLRSYEWPGNVRELQSVIERAVITARDGRLDLDRALPQFSSLNLPATPEPVHVTSVRTLKELEDLERANLITALMQVGWRVSGRDGAARLLGMNPSTLSSRIKALRIKRPD